MSKFNFIEGGLPTGPKPGCGPSPVLLEFAEECRKRPGVWAEYPSPMTPSSQRNTAWLIGKHPHRAPAAFQDGGFEASVRDGVLYVRFIGGES